MPEDKFLKEQSVIEKELKRQERLAVLRAYEGDDRVVLAEEAKALYAQVGGFSVKTGIPMLDEVTEGFREGELVVVSGPTKNGKTEFCKTLSVTFGKTVPCVWFPFEGGYRAFFAKYPGNLDFYIPQKPKDHSVRWVEDRIIESKLKFGTKVVFIDNLDFLYDDEATKAAGVRDSNFATYVGGIVKKLKEIAMEQEMIVFLMVHLGKAKWSKLYPPESSDIRDSSRIPQLSDFVLMITRAKNEDGTYIAKNAMLRVAENRYNGNTKIIGLNLEDDGLFYEAVDWMEEFDEKYKSQDKNKWERK